jgi:hypothetical protein
VKYIAGEADVPKEPHFAILEFSSVYHEGDERSRTHPGHGYPAYTENVCHYIVFSDEKEWKEEIVRRKGLVFGNHNFVGLRVTPAEIKTTYTINVE